MSEQEVAIEKQKETTKAVESDFVEMVSFLHRISRAVGQVFRATSIHGRLSVPVTIDFPVSALILEGQEERYDIFKKLTKASDCGSSLSVALELTNPYDDVLKDFFPILVIRLVAQTEYICTKEDTLRQTESCHALIRARLEEQRSVLQELRANFSSALSTMRQETMRSTEQLCLKVKQVEEERKRVALALHAERGKSGVITCIQGKCKESLFHEKATLLDLKESRSAHYQELKSRISAGVSETSSCRSTLEELKGGIESLFEACSISREKSKTADDILKADLERLRTALADKEEKIKELMKREADLQNELSSHSGQAIADKEEGERRTASLKEDMKKLMKEKSEIASDAEHALLRMSRTVAKALSAKREALNELNNEKGVVAHLRSELSKASGRKRDRLSDQGGPVAKDSQNVSSAHLRNKIRGGTGGELGRTQEASVEKSKSPLSLTARLTQSVEVHRGSPDGGLFGVDSELGRTQEASVEKSESPFSLTARLTESAKVHRESPEADTCDVDFVPKQKKKRMSTSHSMKSPRHKATRSEGSKPLMAGESSHPQNPEGLRSNESVATPVEVHNAPSKSDAARDED